MLPSPYYQDDFVTLYCSQNTVILPTLPLFDLLLTDPPYGIGLCSGAEGRHGKNGTAYGTQTWDLEPPSPELMALCQSKGKQQIIWGGGYIDLGRTTFQLVWDKRVPEGTDFSKAEIAWTNLKRKSVQMFRYRWSGAIQEDRVNPEKRYHPAQKPIALMNWCLGFAPKAQTVLDPFAGCGSTLIAAKKAGLRAVGIEMSPVFCEAAAERLRSL